MNKFKMFERGGVHPISVLCETPWNLREWLREVATDPTLAKVLAFILPDIVRAVELALIDAGMSGEAAQLPQVDDITATSIIAFIESIELPGGIKIVPPAGKPPKPWKTLSRKRAEKLAIQLVNEDGSVVFDWQNESDLETIQAMDSYTLEKLWDACVTVCGSAQPLGQTTEATDFVTLSINDRMWLELQRNAESWEWTCEKWAQFLGVKSKASIHGTTAWKTIMGHRANSLLQRKNRRTENGD